MALEGVGEYDSCANPDVTYDKYGGLDSLLAAPPPAQGNLSQGRPQSRGVRRGNDGKGAWNCHTLS